MFGCGPPVGTRVVDGRLCNVYRKLDGSQPEHDFWVDYAFPIALVQEMESGDGEGDADVAAGMSQQELVSHPLQAIAALQPLRRCKLRSIACMLNELLVIISELCS